MESEKKTAYKLPEAFQAKYKLKDDSVKSSMVNGRRIEWENATEDDIQWAVKYKCPALVLVKESSK